MARLYDLSVCIGESQVRLVDGVLDVLEAHRATILESQADNVEAHRPRVRVPAQVVGGELLQLAYFLGADSFLREPEAGARARLDLDEDERGTILRDEIQLAERRAKIARHDSVAEAAQMVLGELLAASPKTWRRPRRRRQPPERLDRG